MIYLSLFIFCSKKNKVWAKQYINNWMTSPVCIVPPTPNHPGINRAQKEDALWKRAL